jgi:hypothetical protein
MKKNTLGSPAISMTMRMRRCDRRASPDRAQPGLPRGATDRLHRAIIRTVSPRRVRHGYNKHPKKNF